MPPSNGQYRISALHCLGLLHLDGGDLDEAERCADLAEPLLRRAAGPQDRGKFLWFRAALCRRRGRLVESESLFRQVVDVLLRHHHGEAALAAVELIQVVVEQRKPGEAQRICQSLWPLLEPLERNPLIGAAFGELLRAGARGSLDLDLMKRIKASIESEKTRRDAKARPRWRALAVKA